MSDKLYIIGAGGHGKVLADIAVKCGYTEIAFLDDHATGDCMGVPIVGVGMDIDALAAPDVEFIIAVGNNATRKRIAEAHDVRWATLIHPSAQIGMHVSIGCGTVVVAGAVVNPCATVGKHCIINTCAVVEHDNVLEDYVHISPNAALGGTVTVGECTHIGIGASVRNNIRICGDSIIGVGAVIVKDIDEAGVYVGDSGRKIK